MMLSGEAGLAGEGLARRLGGLSSSIEEVGGGDTEAVEFFLSLRLVFRFFFFRVREVARGEITTLWRELSNISGSSSIASSPDPTTSSSNLSSWK
jgi:hypothetical protein